MSWYEKATWSGRQYGNQIRRTLRMPVIRQLVGV